MADKQAEALATVQSQLSKLQQLLGLLRPKGQNATEAVAGAQFHLRAAARALADVGKPDE